MLVALVILGTTWCLLAGCGGMVSVGRRAYVGVGGYAPIRLADAVRTPPWAAVLAAFRGTDRVDRVGFVHRFALARTVAVLLGTHLLMRSRVGLGLTSGGGWHRHRPGGGVVPAPPHDLSGAVRADLTAW